jgi:hypothetical protein
LHSAWCEGVKVFSYRSASQATVILERETFPNPASVDSRYLSGFGIMPADLS